MITSLGSLGTANDKSGGTTQLDMAVTRTVPVGNFLVAWVGWDNVYSVFVDTEAEEAYQPFDSQGNTWTLVAVCDDKQDFFNSGGWAGIFVTQVDYELTTADTISILGATSFLGNLIAKAISVEEFEISIAGDPCRWVQGPSQGGHTYAGLAVYNSIESRGADPDSLGVDMTVGSYQYNREWLVLHCLAAEAPDTDVFTWDPAWTEITGTGTTGAADDSNIALRGGYQVLLGHTTSVDVTNTTSSTRDNSQTMVAIGLTKVTEFPTTPLVDDFNRADEYPMDGGLWETVHVFLQPGEAYGSAFGWLTSNQMGGNPGGSALLEDWGPCAEAWSTISDFAGFPNLHICTNGNTNSSSFEGHGVSWATASEYIVFGRSHNEGGVDRGKEFVWPRPGATGDKWGLQRTCEGDLFVTRLWLDQGDGYKEVAAIALRDEGNGRRAAIAMEDAAGRQDNFGGGEIECDCGKRHVQIMRY